MYGIVTLYDSAFQPNYPQSTAGNAPLDYNSYSAVRQHDFQVELLPLHSQLLGESLLVSFPPLINMLKSSGSSYLISGPIVRTLRRRLSFLRRQRGGGLGHAWHLADTQVCSHGVKRSLGAQGPTGSVDSSREPHSAARHVLLGGLCSTSLPTTTHHTRHASSAGGRACAPPRRLSH